MPPPSQSTARSPAAAQGRRVASIAYWVLVGAIIAASAVEVTLQVLFTPKTPGPFTGCHEGVRALQAAIERARLTAAGVDGEDAALARFRSALNPEWSFRDGIAELCKGTPRDEAALDAIERLRYAEDHAVRREAGELAPLRRRVQAIVDGELPRDGASPKPPKADTK